MLSGLLHEFRLGLRGLLRDKGFAIAAVLSIGLGVGANSAIFSLVDQALLRLLPVKEPDRLVLLTGRAVPSDPAGQQQPQLAPVLSRSGRATDVFDGCSCGTRRA
jgi:hypothetical protein